MEQFALTLILLLLGHFIGDFLLQSREMATRKSKEFLVLLEHGLMVFVGIMGAGFMIGDMTLLFVVFAVGNAIVHIIWDYFGWNLFYKLFKDDFEKNPYYKNYWFYTVIGLDQFFHVSILLVSYYYVMGV